MMIKRIIFFVLCAITPFILNAQQGTLDTSFNQTGIFNLDTVFDYPNSSTEQIADIVEQSDGKLLVLGTSFSSSGFFEPIYCKLFRLNIDGTLDPAFGDGGIFSYSTYQYQENLFSKLYKIILLDDGNIFVVGKGRNIDSLEDETIIIKLNSSGILDETYGSGGVARFLGGEIKGSLFYDNSYYLYGSKNSDGFIIKIDANGAINYNFNGVGSLSQDIDGGYNDFQKIIVKSGKLLAFGIKENSNGQKYVTICKYDLDGNLDYSYGTLGITKSFLYDEYQSTINDLKVLDNGKYLLSVNGNFYQLTTYGNLDESFAPYGKKKNPLNERFSCMMFINENKIIMSSGVYNSNSNVDMSIKTVKLNLDLSLDTSFGTNGVSINNVYPNYKYEQYSEKIAQLSNGKIIVAGNFIKIPNTNVPSIKNQNYFVLRYNNSLESLSTQAIINDSDIIISPNPVKDILYIKSTEKIEKAEIYDLSGRLIKVEIGVVNNQINVSALKAGNYIIKLQTSDKKAIQTKFIKH